MGTVLESMEPQGIVPERVLARPESHGAREAHASAELTMRLRFEIPLAGDSVETWDAIFGQNIARNIEPSPGAIE